jgi:hypothetical protein
MQAGTQKNIIVYLALLIYYHRQNTSTLGNLGILVHFRHFVDKLNLYVKIYLASIY